ncbi:MAG: DUF4836 family protein [Bacteroidota bacterium]
MKQSLFYLGSLLILLVTFSSCSSKADAPVPADAAFVLHINGESISEKLPWSEIKKSQWFQLATEDAVDEDSLGKALLNDPSKSGIDIQSDGWIFIANRGKGGYSALSWKLKDAAQFESLIQKANTDDKIQKSGAVSFIGKGSTVLSWSKDRLFLVSDASDFARELNGGANNSSPVPDTLYDSPFEESFSFKADSLIQIAQELFNLKSGQKLSNDSKFSNLVKTEGDVHFWFNVGKMYGNSLAGNLLSLSKVGSLVDGNIATATVNFNKGSIDVESKGYMGKELEALYDKYQASNFDVASLQNLPAGEVNVAVAMNYPTEGVKAFFTLLGVDGLVNTFMQQSGFSVDEFIKANGGNLFFALTDFNIKKVEQSFGGYDEQTIFTSEPDGKLIFGAEVKDKTAFQKMMDVAKNILTGTSGMSQEELSKIPYELKDKWFLAGSDSAQIKAYANKKTDHAFIDQIKGHPMGLFVNISSFIKAALAVIGDEPMGKAVANLSIPFWKDLVMTGGEFKNGASISQVKINLGDANTNSLQSLNQYLGQIAKLSKEDEERRKKEWDEFNSPDSTVIIAPEY